MGTYNPFFLVLKHLCGLHLDQKGNEQQNYWVPKHGLFHSLNLPMRSEENMTPNLN